MNESINVFTSKLRKKKENTVALYPCIVWLHPIEDPGKRNDCTSKLRSEPLLRH